MRELTLVLLVTMQFRVARSSSMHAGALSAFIGKPRWARSWENVCTVQKVSMLVRAARQTHQQQVRQRPASLVRMGIPSKNLSAVRGNDLAMDTPTLSLPNIVSATLLEEILPNCGVTATSQSNGAGRRSVTMIMGVSGGCDSTALLHVIHDLIKTRQSCNGNDSDEWNLVVAHFDHEQRGAASDGDREFVVTLCEQLQIPVYCYYWSDEVRTYHTSDSLHSGKQSTFSQDTARRWRRRTMRTLFHDIVRDDTTDTTTRCGLLLTAHHKDDSEETLLLKLLRGVHISNLSGLTACTQDDSFEPLSNDHRFHVAWARPFIHVRKADIVQYLQQRHLIWREDASNQSDKYLRNRVRNELLPLLTDLTGDADILSKRLENLSEQAEDVRRDLNTRVQEHYSQQAVNGTFQLSLPNARFDLIAKQALHFWLSEQSNGHVFSYDQIRRIIRQIQDHPERRVWRLAIGESWNVLRQGDVLKLACEDDSVTIGRENNPSESPVSWRHLDDNERLTDVKAIEIGLSFLPDPSLQLTQITPGDSKLSITPVWRSNHGPVRLAEFLRGQQVPLHLRKEATVIVLRQANHESLIAVYVSTRQKWVVDAAFAVDDSKPPVQYRLAITVNV